MMSGGRLFAGFAASGARRLLLSALILISFVSLPAQAENSEILTLGTMAGPMANTERSQPATLLSWQDGMILVDAGDGAVVLRPGKRPVVLIGDDEKAF